MLERGGFLTLFAKSVGPASKTSQRNPPQGCAARCDVSMNIAFERCSDHSPDFVYACHPKPNCEYFWLAPGHDGARTVAFELPGGGDVSVSGRTAGLSKRVVQVLYQARRVKIVSPEMLTRICIQIALVVSYRMK